MKQSLPHQLGKGEIFRDLHTADDIFVMPNAWNAGSACMLESADFPAIGTTSAGIAYCLGLPDYEGALSRDAALEETRRIAMAVSIPMSADTENGYGHEPVEVAETIRLFAEAGAVGASIEDFAASFGGALYDRSHAADRIRAAKEAAESLGFSFTLTARAECYLVGHPDPFNESVARANLYREAGADCLFVPGVKDAETIASLVNEVDGPISVVMGLTGNALSVSELASLGVKRVSIGGSLARATFGLIRRAAEEIHQQGTFNFAQEQVPDDELCRYFSARTVGSKFD
jgi:2-methylisocitrate lyase-like PEP mutase family enzyme